MTMRHVDIDDQLLEDVKAYLGTKTIKETINAALRYIAGNPDCPTAIDLSADPVAVYRTRAFMKRPWRGPGFWSTTAS
ncbi:MAG TPA: type II toxin-antitoxin system VapB family antitoxin [Actinophytocola sp.]|uniref:type II toxin-antitoxin system VapB family antitoxin n=1 Tax=Actinophytocola sp. TaxID=1872138 RepID=UPI002DDCCE7B|nr:type II toxin-antitoxin system VapB family antitoxin [Actinophytocola sp.]HEV2783498.1 type II toxin-antitoxin system VapB family antitoxin [Actinophytocola sp.]